MAATITLVSDGNDVWGRTRTQRADVALDASYPAGGYAITPAQVAMSKIFGASVIGSILATASGGYMFIWDAVAGKLRVFWPTNATPSEGAGVEVTTATSLTGVSVKLLFMGN